MNINKSKADTGIFFIKNRNKWLAQIKYNGKGKFLGHFNCKEDAIKKREQFVTMYVVPKKTERLKFENDIIKLYNSGKTQTEIANSIDCAASSICQILKKHKVIIRSNKSNIDELKLIERYSSGETIQNISNETGFSHGTISSRLKKLGVSVRPNRKYFFDETMFEKIDCEWKSYFLGLLYADGWIGKTSIVIRLQEKDRDILEEINTKIYNKQNPLRFNPARKFNHKNGKIINQSAQYGLSINSKKCVEDIKRLGCGHKKSLVLKFPTENIIPKKVFHHFIRGYFDGDGTSYHSKKSKSATISIVGSDDYCIGFYNFLTQKLNVSAKVKKEKSISRVNTSRREDVIKIYNYMYKDSTIHLNRKKEKIENWIKNLPIDTE